MNRSRPVGRILAGTGILLVVLFSVSVGAEVAKGTDAPLSVTVRRAAAIGRRLGELSGLSGPRVHPPDEEYVGDWRVEAHPSEGVSVMTRRDRVYALGVLPLGKNFFAREVSRNGPLDASGVRLVWWSGGVRHVVDTADRSNGRIEPAATSVEVKGWIPFEASAYGVETLGAGGKSAEWREDLLHGSRD